MTTMPRVALFTDSYYEANGVARTSSALETYAARHDLPLLIVHGGSANQFIESGSVARLEIRRADRTSFSLDHDLRFDLMLWRHARQVTEVLRWFRPDVLHFTGPSDVGQLGAWLGHRSSIPMVGSWHTNLHEYASHRLLKHFARASDLTRMHVRLWVEQKALAATLQFYRIPRVILAPNEEWLQLLERRTRKPAFLMTRGVDTEFFTPDKRTMRGGPVNIGYVGRLAPEKNVRALSAVAKAFATPGGPDVRFTIVGDGSEGDWLRQALPDADFTGVLRGEALAEAYANMDVFVFPSETETVGNVVLEAMASGVPVVVMERGGPRFITGSGQGAHIARDVDDLVRRTISLVSNRARREAMGATARASACERSWDSVFDAVYRAYALAIAMAREPERLAADQLVRAIEKQPMA